MAQQPTIVFLYSQRFVPAQIIQMAPGAVPARALPSKLLEQDSSAEDTVEEDRSG